MKESIKKTRLYSDAETKILQEKVWPKLFETEILVLNQDWYKKISAYFQYRIRNLLSTEENESRYP